MILSRTERHDAKRAAVTEQRVKAEQPSSAIDVYVQGCERVVLCLVGIGRR